MKSIVAENVAPADLKKYGLDKPVASVTLSLGSAKASLLLGGKSATAPSMRKTRRNRS